jgi:ApaG protein
MEVCTTNGITVKVETQFLPAHSNAKSHKYLFGYHISIENGSTVTIQLLRRRWMIWDSNGIIREVDGEGVVGLQPVIAPGEVYSYSSYCNLMTEIGRMSGNYLMHRMDTPADFMEVTIPAFWMVLPWKWN